jgi:hypothetical protein
MLIMFIIVREGLIVISGEDGRDEMMMMMPINI